MNTTQTPPIGRKKSIHRSAWMLFLYFIPAFFIGQRAVAKCVVCSNINQGGWDCAYFEQVDCGNKGIPVSGYNSTPNGFFQYYCKQLMLVPDNPPTIYYTEEGHAVLDNNGQVVTIASDKMSRFMATKHTDGELQKALAGDDGTVSRARIDIIAKELTGKIVKVKSLPAKNYCPACDDEQKTTPDEPATGRGNDQAKVRSNGNGTRLNFNLGGGSKLAVFTGAGTILPASDVMDDTHLTNMTSLNLDITKMIWHGRKVALGVNFGGVYSRGNQSQSGALPTAFHVNGETSTTVVARTSGGPQNTAFIVEAGPQLDLFIGRHLVVSPMFLAGYTGVTQKEYSVVQTTEYNGKSSSYTLLKQAETKTTGLAMIPKIRVHYYFSRSIGIWAEGNYLLGPSVKTTTTTWRPNGLMDQKGMYNNGQMEEGAYTSWEKSSSYNALGISGGIVIGIGKTQSRMINTHPSTGTVPLTIGGIIPKYPHTRVFCERGKKVMKYYNAQGLVAPDQVIFSDIPCNEASWPIDGVEGDLSVNSVHNWDGSIGGLFNVPIEIRTLSIRNGLAGIISQLNQTPGTQASRQEDKGQQFLKIVTKKSDKEYITQLLPYHENGPMADVINSHIDCLGSCPSGCIVYNPSGTYSCTGCATGAGKCVKMKTDGAYGHTWYTDLNPKIFVEDNATNPDLSTSPELNDFVKKLLPSGYGIKRTEIVKESKASYLIVLAGNASNGILLINKISTHEWISFYNDQIPSQANNLRTLISNSMNATTRHDYVGHVTLLR